MRECGLKFRNMPEYGLMDGVTPCAGVWIEITRPKDRFLLHPVTPCAGVWIEISNWAI